MLAVAVAVAEAVLSESMVLILGRLMPDGGAVQGRIGHGPIERSIEF